MKRGWVGKQKEKKQDLMKEMGSKRDTFNLWAKNAFIQKYQLMKKRESSFTGRLGVEFMTELWEFK